MNNNNRGPIRQGDVWLKPIDKIPLNLEKSKVEYSIRFAGREVGPNKHNQLILALGEKSGHKHWFENADNNSTLFLDSVNNMCYLQMNAEGVLMHDEHPAVSVPVGNYKVVMQREHVSQERVNPPVID